MRPLAALALACACALMAGCDWLTGPGDGGFPERWELIPVDRSDVALYPVGITASGTVIGTMHGSGAPKGEAFRWTNGKFEQAGIDGSAVMVVGINERGDAIGVVGATFLNGALYAKTGAFVWWAGDSKLTPLFVSDNSLVPVDINNRGDILFAPNQYYPGAGVNRGAEQRAVPGQVPITPYRLTDSGIVVGKVRGELQDRWVRVASPFEPGVTVPPNDARCPWGHARVAVFADHANTVITEIYRDGSLAFTAIDDGATCRSADVVSNFRARGRNANGWYWGATIDSNRAAVAYAGRYRQTRTLAGTPGVDVAWEPANVIGISASGDVLVNALRPETKTLASKGGPVILRPR